MAMSFQQVALGNRRPQSNAEFIADGIIHIVGLTAALCGTIGLVALALLGGHSDVLQLLVYCGGMLAMFGASAAYNLGYGTRFRHVLQSFDHSAIFLMITGTYTPFITNGFSFWAASLLLVLIWGWALCGIAMRLFWPAAFARYSLMLYLGLGWMAVIFIAPQLYLTTPQVLIPLIIGGLLYTGGVLFHVGERLPFQNAIWHVFVLAAAASHYYAVVESVLLRASA
ncbi:MAG: hemolysin III family protein [Hyphomicrobiales bacterium]|nr:hemolysin III family protein [Hyphomicrobiales bacterium]